ncbi:keratin-associated protein 15-1 [Nannospalax galili]|uniref:Keratin-associated protein n=1 Tax=Nannospalax galili TaxID=1026970 RepID=A0A8C6R5J6_NANGA|nr:keratin-associated protein 15-1 [Nannospalax galili]
MSYNCSSGHFSSQSLGGYLRHPVSTYNSFYPSNAFYSPKAFQLGSSFYNGQQENFGEPLEEGYIPSVGTRYHLTSYRPNNFILCSPSRGNFTGSFGYSHSGLGSFGFGSSGIQSVGGGSSFHRPAYFSSKSVQSSYYQPGCGSRFYGSSF